VSHRTPYVLDDPPSPADVLAVAAGRQLALGPGALARIAAGRAVVERALAADAPVYGLTTATGALKHLGVGDQGAFNRGLIERSATGHGPHVPAIVVRATMVARVAGFARGGTGVRPAVAAAYVAALNAGFVPRVRSIGSLGQSDLAPCGEIARALIGQGPDGDAFRAAGLEPIVPQPKDGIGMVSANAYSVGWACVALDRADRALRSLDAAAALSYEALPGNASALDPAVADARPYPGLRASLERVRGLLVGGEVLGGGVAGALQDPLCFRVVPQTHGTARQALRHATELVSIELASAGDNPLVSSEQDRLLSTGNFDSSTYGAGLDYARIGFAHAVTIAIERTQKLLNGAFTGLLTGLRERPETTDSALVLVGYTAAAAGSEARLLAAPVTLELSSTSVDAGVDDRMTMTSLAARRLDEQASLGLHVAAAEMVCAAQAIDLRGRSAALGTGTGSIYALVREHVAFAPDGTALPGDLAALERGLADRCP
jgi:histidine ammonia-lyase